MFLLVCSIADVLEDCLNLRCMCERITVVGSVCLSV